MRTTIEETRQRMVAQKWMKKHPEYVPNEIDALAMYDVIDVNGLDWTFQTLEIAYKILKLKGHEFMSRKFINKFVEEKCR
jgi:hypothetical protein